MEVPITFQGLFPFRDNLTIIKQLCPDNTSLYQVYSFINHAHYALKIFSKSSSGKAQFQSEQLVLSLNHLNITKTFPMSWDKEGYEAMLFEFYQYGDFFDIVLRNCLDSEILVRTYFHQLIEGIEYIHSQGIAHLDLKLENLMLGPDFQLKIIDFGHAQFTADKIFRQKGTIKYRAPEIKDESCTDPCAADVFSAGIILYCFKSMEFPFVEKEDPVCQDLNAYSTFLHNNDKFWEAKAFLKKKKGFFSQDLIQLINGMLKHNPEERLTIKEIKENKWYQGSVLDSQSLQGKMKAKI